jgi:hypothetical protein
MLYRLRLLLPALLLLPGILTAQQSFTRGRAGVQLIGAAYVVPVLYGTGRSIKGGTDHRSYYGNERAPLDFGVCEAGIPPNHAKGSLEAPAKIFPWNAEKHVVRAGDMNTSPDRVDRMDIINADAVSYSMDGHSYFSDSRPVLDDLAEVLDGKPVGDRKNVMLDGAGRHYNFRR